MHAVCIYHSVLMICYLESLVAIPVDANGELPCRIQSAQVRSNNKYPNSMLAAVGLPLYSSSTDEESVTFILAQYIILAQ